MLIFAAFAAFAALRGPKTFKTEGKLSAVGRKPPSHSEKSKNNRISSFSETFY